MQEDYPRIYIVRRMAERWRTLLWPLHLRPRHQQLMDVLRQMFPYLTCNREITGKDKRPCLYYYIGRCLGPCIGAASKEEYRALIEQIMPLPGRQA